MSSINAAMTYDQRLKELRQFGLVVGGVWAGIGLWPLIVRDGTPRLWALLLAIGLVLPALIVPGKLKLIHRVWMFVGSIMGWFSTRVVLGVVFFGMMTPMGLMMRRFSGDPLRRKFDPKAETYRVRRQRRSPSHLMRQF